MKALLEGSVTLQDAVQPAMASAADQDKHLVALQVAPPREVLQQEVAAQVAAATKPLREQVGSLLNHFLHLLIRLHQTKVCRLASLLWQHSFSCHGPGRAAASVLHYLYIRSAKDWC